MVACAMLGCLSRWCVTHNPLDVRIYRIGTRERFITFLRIKPTELQTTEVLSGGSCLFHLLNRLVKVKHLHVAQCPRPLSSRVMSQTSTIALPVPQKIPSEAASLDQATVFRNLRYRLLRNSLRVAMETGRLRLFTMLATSAVVALFVFGLSWYGFQQLFSFKVPVKGAIVGGLFDIMFFTLGVMLIFSTGIILYASLFTSPESRFLLATPARADRIFATKFQAAVAFSSWAFLILGLPILIAYGIAADVPWYFYALLPIYLLGYVLIPASVSAIGCMILVRILPRNRKQALILLGLSLVALGLFWLARVGLAAKQSLVTGKKNEVEGLIGQFSLTRHPLMPSHWMTNGLSTAARGEGVEALLPLAMLLSNGFMLYMIAAWIAGRVYRSAFDRMTGGSQGKKVYGANFLDRIMEWLVFYLDRPTRILIVKDFRTFRRDPTQWVLLFVFGGLMLLGASNFRQYYRNDLAMMDQYIVSFVNLGATSVLLCAGLSRFIFPLMSLEGRKFWILGLMPLPREKILFGKFAFAATGSVIIACGLTLLGDGLLGLPWQAILAHLVTACAIALGLSAMNVGLGAAMPNFRETDPSKIVVGFGGTVNMVLGLLYLTLVLAIGSGPIHAAGLRGGLPGMAGNVTSVSLPYWAFAGLPIVLLLSAIAIWLPLRAGARSLRNTEF